MTIGVVNRKVTAMYHLSDTADSSGSGYTLTNTSTVTFPQGRFDNCCRLVSASAQQLYVRNNMGIDGGNITMSCWMKIEAVPVSGTDGTVYGQMSTNTATEYCVLYRYYSGGSYFYFDRARVGVADDVFTYTVSLSTSIWYNLITTYDGTALKGYLNGAYVGSFACSGNGNNKVRDNYFRIGAVNSAANFFDGYIDEVIVQNSAWTYSQIRNYYNFSMGRYAPKIRL